MDSTEFVEWAIAILVPTVLLAVYWGLALVTIIGARKSIDYLGAFVLVASGLLLAFASFMLISDHFNLI